MAPPGGDTSYALAWYILIGHGSLFDAYFVKGLEHGDVAIPVAESISNLFGNADLSL